MQEEFEYHRLILCQWLNCPTAMQEWLQYQSEPVPPSYDQLRQIRSVIPYFYLIESILDRSVPLLSPPHK